MATKQPTGLLYNPTLNAGNANSTPAAGIKKPSANPLDAAYGGTQTVYTNSPTSLGVQAKSPNQNIVAPSNTLPKGQAVTPPSTTNPTVPQGAKTISSNPATPVQNPAPSTSPVPNPTPTSTPTPAPTNGLYGQLIGQLQNIGQNGSQAVNDANKALTDSKMKEANVIAGDYQKSAPLFYTGGLAQIAANQFNAQQNALTGQVTNALTGQGQQISALNNAVGATAPIQAPYSNQVLNPVTGQPVGGGAAGQLPAEAQNVITTYADQVKNGSMTRADAESRLSAYGVAGINALTQALGGNFNTNASNASAQTTAQGQQLQTQAQSANSALDTLQSKFNSLSSLQTGGIPATNSIANWIASSLGSASLTEYNQTLHDARQQLQGVLAAAGGGTPTGYESTAVTYLPDNMTPTQLTQAIGNVKSLIQQKVSAFTQSGSQGGNTGGSNIFGSFFSK